MKVFLNNVCLTEYIPYSNFGNYEDVMRRVPDISKICSTLGFKPSWELEEGLKVAIDWQKKFYQ